MKTQIEIYRDIHHEWRWRAKRKGRIVCDGAEGYKRRYVMLKSLRAFLKSIRSGQWTIEGK